MWYRWFRPSDHPLRGRSCHVTLSTSRMTVLTSGSMTSTSAPPCPPQTSWVSYTCWSSELPSFWRIIKWFPILHHAYFMLKYAMKLGSLELKPLLLQSPWLTSFWNINKWFLMLYYVYFILKYPLKLEILELKLGWIAICCWDRPIHIIPSVEKSVLYILDD